MTDTDARSVHERGQSDHHAVAARLEGRSKALGAARLTVVAVGLAIVGAIVWARWGMWAWALLGALVVVFVVLVVVHASVEQAIAASTAAARFHTRALARIGQRWSDLSAGSARFASPEHPFTGDLDVFGKASLMQAVDATETRFGEDRLAALLSQRSESRWPDGPLERAAAARDLAPRVSFRERLATAAGVLATDKPDPRPLVAWAEGTGDELPPGAVAGAWVVSAIGIVALAFGGVLGLSSEVRTVVVVAAMGLGLAASARLNRLLSVLSAQEPGATRWAATFAAVEGEAFEAPALAALRSVLVRQDRAASREMASLERIVGYVDARRNDAFRLFIGPLLMWDVHCAAALLAWRARAGANLRRWFAALGEVEAMASLGAFAFEHPTFAWPEFAADPWLEATGLAHPLLPEEHRIGNDVRLPGAAHAYVVTGSNMSGKSTLLRAIGVNAVLAAAGAPVCARAMRLGSVRVATSMRIDDSLAHGVSHFYAELLRLKLILGMAREPAGPAVLFLLDEILHGTNSRERVLGAAAIVRELLARGALGAVSTHDLGIVSLERDLAGKIENVHFEEQVENDVMTFDYALRPGVVQSSNALRLMHALGIAVDA